MATLEENINQAIADFDDIEKAIEEQGVDVPSGTDTKEYGNLIRSIPRGAGGGTVDINYNPQSENAQSGFAVAEALAGLPIKYVEGSSNADEVTYLRDLESGTYVLKGTFKPYEGSGTVCRFSSNLLVNVVKGTLNKVPTSHIQIFYPVNNVVQFCDITDESYKRTDIKLNELANAATVEEMIALANNTAKKLYSNAIKANASGEVVRVDDVSPVEHKARAKVSGKNCFNALNISLTGEKTDYAYISNVDVGKVVVYSNTTDNGYCSSGKTLRNVCGDLKVGIAYTLTAITDSTSRTYIYLTGAEVRWDFGSTKILTEEMLDSVIVFYGLADGEGNGDCNISNIQLEIGDTATEYEPYIEPTSVTVTRCGKNLINVDDISLQGQTAYYHEFITDITPIIGRTYTLSADVVTDALPASLAVGCGKTIFQSELVPFVAKDFYANERISVTFTWNLTAEQIELGYTKLAVRVPRYSTSTNFTATVSNIQLEEGDKATEYEAYTAETYTPSADGTVEINSLAPTMTLLTDKEGVNIELEYNQDANKALENMREDIRTLDNDMAELKANLPDIDEIAQRVIELLPNGDEVRY